MAKRRVPGPAASVRVMTPGDRVIPHVSTGVAAFIHGHQHVNRSARLALKILPLVGSLPRLRQWRGGAVIGILDVDKRALIGWVAAKVCPDQLTVPGPAILGVGGGMDAHVAIAALDVALKRGLLILIEHGACGGEKDYQLVVGQTLISEETRVLGSVDTETVRGAQVRNCRDPIRNRVVPISSRLGEDQRRKLRTLHTRATPMFRCARRTRRKRQSQGDPESADAHREPSPTAKYFGHPRGREQAPIPAKGCRPAPDGRCWLSQAPEPSFHW